MSIMHQHPSAEDEPVVVPASNYPKEVDRNSVLYQTRRLIATLRSSPHRRQIALLAVGSVLVLIGNMVGQVRLNQWHGDFFDAIEDKGLAAFGQQLVIFLGIIAVLLALRCGADLAAGDAKGADAGMADASPV